MSGNQFGIGDDSSSNCVVLDPAADLIIEAALDVDHCDEDPVVDYGFTSPDVVAVAESEQAELTEEVEDVGKSKAGFVMQIKKWIRKVRINSVLSWTTFVSSWRRPKMRAEDEEKVLKLIRNVDLQDDFEGEGDYRDFAQNVREPMIKDAFPDHGGITVRCNPMPMIIPHDFSTDSYVVKPSKVLLRTLQRMPFCGPGRAFHLASFGFGPGSSGESDGPNRVPFETNPHTVRLGTMPHCLEFGPRRRNMVYKLHSDAREKVKVRMPDNPEKATLSVALTGMLSPGPKLDMIDKHEFRLVITDGDESDETKD